jgi:hypothetical protein
VVTIVPVALAYVQSVSAAEISIVNPSFESGTSGWTNAGGVFDAFPPGPGYFFDPVPDGVSVLYLGGESPGPAYAAQTLGQTVQANTTYVLEFWVGLRADSNIQPTPYTVSLLPFSTPINCGVPGHGHFMDCSTSFQSSGVQVGQQLAIRIDVAGPNANDQMAFDAFRLTTPGNTVPEPGTFSLLAATGLASILRRVRKNRWPIFRTTSNFVG